MSEKIRTIDLFCGAGGSSVGARNAGVDIVAGFDIWKPAIKTYQTNFPNVATYHADIRQVLPKVVRSEIGDIDLILASPECTSHSIARGAKEKNEESRKTAFQVTRFAHEFKPQWIIVENVIRMQSWSEHSKLLDELWDMGYFVRQVALNAKDFNVPQSRRRLFMLCSLSGKAEIPATTTEQYHNVSSIIDTSDKYHMTPLRKLGRAQATIDRADRAIATLGKEEPFLIVYYGSDKAGGWQSLDRPLRTITTLDRFAYVKPDKGTHLMRMLQPEELKLAMGFSPSFKLDEVEGLTRRQRVKLMGNGVCPPVMQSAIQALIP